MTTLPPRSSDEPDTHEPDHINAPWEMRNGCCGQTAWLAVIVVLLASRMLTLQSALHEMSVQAGVDPKLAACIVWFVRFGVDKL